MSYLQVPPERIRLRKVGEHYQVEHRNPLTKQWKLIAVVKQRTDGVAIARRLTKGVGRKAA